MVSIKKNIISLTRGDTLRTKVIIKLSDGTVYEPVNGDIITFGLKTTINDTECIIEKNIPIDTMELHLAPEDTKELPYGAYVYDIQIQFNDGDIYTFIPYTKFNITGEVV